MNPTKSLALAILILCIPLTALAGNVTFTNEDGTFQSNASGTLTLTGSTLIGIQGLSPYIPDSVVTFPQSLGTLTLTTGSMTSGSILTSATFGTGGSISYTYTNGVVFTGSFSSAQWISSGTNAWTFIGTITSGTLTVPGYAPVAITNAVTIDLTTVGAAPTANGSGGYNFEDSGGTMNFPEPALSAVPELSTLTLLGSGLVGVAILARRRSKKANARES